MYRSKSVSLSFRTPSSNKFFIHIFSVLFSFSIAVFVTSFRFLFQNMILLSFTVPKSLDIINIRFYLSSVAMQLLKIRISVPRYLYQQQYVGKIQLQRSSIHKIRHSVAISFNRNSLISPNQLFPVVVQCISGERSAPDGISGLNSSVEDQTTGQYHNSEQYDFF